MIELTRREFGASLTFSIPAAWYMFDCTSVQADDRMNAGGKRMPFLLFTSSGRTGRINSNGSDLHYFDFNVAGQVTWQPGPLLQDGRRIVFLSMEKRRDGPGKPFAEYYTQTPTHLWVYDFAKKTLTEICTKDRLAVFYTPALLLSDERILVQVVKSGVGQILYARRLPESRVAWEFQADRPDTDHFNRDFKPELARGGTEICRINPLNGSITRLTTSSLPAWDFRATESPDGKHIAFCRAQTGGYPELWMMNPDGQNQRLITRGLDDPGVDYPRWVG